MIILNANPEKMNLTTKYLTEIQNITRYTIALKKFQMHSK
jgi:hypothetical protein